jgi:uncharacterized protein YlxW (UPF0749 family)
MIATAANMMLAGIRSRADAEEAAAHGDPRRDARTLGAVADIRWLLNRVEVLQQEVNRLEGVVASLEER